MCGRDRDGLLQANAASRSSADNVLGDLSGGDNLDGWRRMHFDPTRDKLFVFADVGISRLCARVGIVLEVHFVTNQLRHHNIEVLTVAGLVRRKVDYPTLLAWR